MGPNHKSEDPFNMRTWGTISASRTRHSILWVGKSPSRSNSLQRGPTLALVL